MRLNKSSFKYNWLLIIILLAISLRLFTAFYLGDQVVELPGTHDQLSYDLLAQRVLAGHGFSFGQDWWPVTRAGEPTAHWSYLYTSYLVVIYALVGYHPLVPRLIQAVLVGFLMPWLTYRVGNRHFGPKVGLVAAGISAFYLYFVYYSAALMTEIFYITSILWVMDQAGQLGQAERESKTNFKWQQVVLFGLSLAVTVLLRQLFLLIIPLIFAWLLWQTYRHSVAKTQAKQDGQSDSSSGLFQTLRANILTKQMAQMMAGLIVATVMVILAIVPWSIRNYRAFDTFVLLNTNAGFAFFWGNHPAHGYNFIPIMTPAQYGALVPAELQVLNEGELDRVLLKEGLSFVAQDPVRYMILSITRIREYFKFWPSTESGLISNLSRVFSFGILLPFILYGLIKSLRQPDFSSRMHLYLFMAAYTGIHLLSWALVRYRLPVDALFLIFAGIAVVDLQAYLTRHWLKRVEPVYNADSL